MKYINLMLLFLTVLLCNSAMAASNLQVLTLQDDWAMANYQLQGEAQEKAFGVLLLKADEAIKSAQTSAELLTWRGIIKSSFAGVKGGLGALSLIKQAKADLEQALQMDDQVLSGSAHTSLGTLYFKAPPWPLSFGDDKLAAQHLKKALEIDPSDIDNNYFYALFLIDQGAEAQAREFLLKAKNAPARADRKGADIGRQNEIKQALKDIK
tara:strand:- start:53204 stop:53833 length:630 start_codon:yes stop_codon:yes gene_type:complete